MQRVDDRVEEHLGAARLTFNLLASEDELSMRLEKMRFFGVPCPTWLMPRIVAEESGEGGRIHFLVTAEVPFVGSVVSYRGYLELSMREAT